MKPLTATRSMRFVLALYSVKSTVLASSSTEPSPLVWPPAGHAAGTAGPREPLTDLTEAVLPDLMREKERRTSGDSSASTWRALRAEVA